MINITLVFPFTIAGKQRTNVIQAEIERNLAIVSFALPYNYDIQLVSAELISKKKYKESWVYVFEFDELDKGIEFVENPIVYVQYKVRVLDSTKAEKEIKKMMEACHMENKKIKRM